MLAGVQSLLAERVVGSGRRGNDQRVNVFSADQLGGVGRRFNPRETGGNGGAPPFVPVGGAAQAYAALLASEIAKWRKVIKDSNIPPPS